MNSNIEIPFEYTKEGDKCQMCYDPNIIEINSCAYCNPSEVETTRNDFLLVNIEMFNDKSAFYKLWAAATGGFFENPTIFVSFGFK